MPHYAEKKDIFFSNSETKNDIKKLIEREIQKIIDEAEKTIIKPKTLKANVLPTSM